MKHDYGMHGHYFVITEMHFSWCFFEHDNSLTNLELEKNSLGAEGTQFVVKMLHLHTKINNLIIIHVLTATCNLAATQLLIIIY